MNSSLKIGIKNSSKIEKTFNLESMNQVGANLFSLSTTSFISGIVKDEDNHMYVAGKFNGEMDGVASGGDDAYILKLNSHGEIIWKKHLHPNFISINSASGDETIVSLSWDKRDGSVYFFGNTTSSFVETNSSLLTSLFWGKLSPNGNLLWIKQLGDETSGKPVAGDLAADLGINSANELILAFSTVGSVFETHAGEGDIGIIKVDTNTGSIIAGRQLGEETLAQWAILKGIPVSGAGRETNGNRNIAMDGNRIVMPFSTNGSLLETKALGFDGAYVVFNEDLTIHELKQFGSATWTSGSVAKDDQFRAVVVNAPNDYLFYGKTASDVVEVNQGVDLFFVRYINGVVQAVNQFGASTLGNRGLQAEEARGMIKGDDGKIYCTGHTRSDFFESRAPNWNIFLFRVNTDGELQEGIQLGNVTATNLNFTTNYSGVQGVDLLTHNGKFILPILNDPVTNGLRSDSWIMYGPTP